MRIVVVGAGISGLAAAYRLVELVGSAEITVVDGAGVPGGKLRTGTLAGTSFETGAEAFVTDDPAGGPSAGVRLARAVGLGDHLVHPANGRAAIAIGGELRPVPGGTLIGIPADPAALAGLADPVVGLDTDRGRPLLAPGEDVAVGELVRDRLGDAVVDRLVDPMLGGVYAGHADRISLRMAIPGLADAATGERTLAAAVAAALAARRAAQSGAQAAANPQASASPRTAANPPAAASPRAAQVAARPAPVFATLDGGLSSLVDAVLGRLRAAGVTVRLGAPVSRLTRSGGGWRVEIGARRAPEPVHADAVVLAAPVVAARRLLPEIGDALGLEYASVALVGLAVPGFEPPELSGILVPADQGFAVKAVTFFDSKWAHLRRADGVAQVRASIGRFGEQTLLHRTDEDLVELVRGELSALLGTAVPAPVDARVQRWGGALPQYPPGHPDRVAGLRTALADSTGGTLALAGAGYDGIGIPACIRSGYAAAEAVAATLRRR